ncbi:hypothetical protein HYC85_030457 [Camellia sinensis]|uniref:Uncharacterized protein n=1 Tax=Camellia sinensis TaxID=4442 RepID=A0A7J7G4U6_CAMSI|nr:hypothetical protein HYC85_030457 [Camellia sinensis]
MVWSGFQNHRAVRIAFCLKLKPVMEGHNPISLFTLLLMKSFVVWLAIQLYLLSSLESIFVIGLESPVVPRSRQRVTVLDLGHMGLQGTISPHLSNFSFPWQPGT